MEAKVTSTRKLEIYPSKHTKDIETAETIFIEDILKLKNEGDSIYLTRRNASGLSCLAYLESRPVEPQVSQAVSQAVPEPSEPTWIDAKQLPPETIRVICYCEGGHMEVGYVDEYHYCRDIGIAHGTDTFDECGYKVIKWMPLPKP